MIFKYIGFVLGFVETVYDVSEFAGAVEICVLVSKPPNYVHFSANVLLLVYTVDGSTSKSVYIPIIP